MLWLIKNSRCALALGTTVTTAFGGWEASFDVLAALNPYVRIVGIGWGWDQRIKLRPWPQFWWKELTPTLNMSTGFAWCGFFIHLGKEGGTP